MTQALALRPSSAVDPAASRESQHGDRCKTMGNVPKKSSVREGLKSVLQRLAARERGGAKTLAAVAGVTPRAVEGWLYADSAPGTAQTLALAARYDEVWELLCLLTGRQPAALSAAEREHLAQVLSALTREEAA